MILYHHERKVWLRFHFFCQNVRDRDPIISSDMSYLEAQRNPVL